MIVYTAVYDNGEEWEDHFVMDYGTFTKREDAVASIIERGYTELSVLDWHKPEPVKPGPCKYGVEVDDFCDLECFEHDDCEDCAALDYLNEKDNRATMHVREVEVDGWPFLFPHLARFDGLEPTDYAAKVHEEAWEVEAEASNGWTDSMLIEVMDVMQSCETALRNSGRTDGQLLALMAEHNAKDEIRGYDKEES